MIKIYSRWFLCISILIFYILSAQARSFSHEDLSGTLTQHSSLPDGIWRAHLLRKDGQEISFNFETRDSAEKKILYVMNGKERLLVDQIRQVQDSLFIQMPFFDSRFPLRISGGNRLDGYWIKNYGDRVVRMPFRAVLNQSARFTVSQPPRFDITGRWSAAFNEDNGLMEAVGEFRQSDYRVTGTFLTTTGDYRFLEGVVDGDSLKISTFDGGDAYYFTAKIDGPGKLSGGLFYAGAVNKETWKAEKNEKAALPDEYSLTRLKNPARATLNFKFKSIDGRMISILSPAFRNKVVIVQIMGSWCPNCMDETLFLSDFYQKNRDRGTEIIALAYERTTHFESSKKSLLSFKTRFHVTYPILVTGVTVMDPLRTEKTLPQLEKIIGFPTTILIDRRGQVRKISTGFNGPGTGDHYEIFKKEFNEQVDSLLNGQ
ncbi:MAG: TlpA disulfide reductase family protein [Bacteroidota bacterium]|nr:TlpA disulfide reductase family protein [Bacteroidota bacterium]MDP4211416.1 TlpA disulfide reductase family protein [Bacteroidota bacterium]MDP4248643.1 TlpA disulfide reductase family protein [Bacteroidota bacterium]